MAWNPGAGPEEHAAPGLADAAAAIHAGARRGRWRRGLIVSVFTLAGLTLAAELALRLTRYRERAFAATVNKTIESWVELTQAGIFEELDDPVRRYALRPGAEAVVGGLTFRVTRQRTRGEDFEVQKPAGEKRMLCLGDSFAFGLWCDDDETLIGHLARLANEREQELGSGTRWRAVDLGVPGYHSGQQLAAFEQDGLALDPDLVVLYFNTNDIEQEGFFFDEDLGVLRRDFLPLPTWLRRRLWSSHLYGWIVSRHRRMVEAGPGAPELDPSVPFAFVRADNQEATRAAIERIAALCRERDVPLFFVNQPHLTWQGTLMDPSWEMLPLVEWAHDLYTGLGLPGVELLGLFRGYADGVDRLAEGAPPDFLLDVYVADERIQDAVAWARARFPEGEWDALPVEQKMASFEGYSGEMPVAPDFHLDGEGYGHLARVTYAAMRAQGVLP